MTAAPPREIGLDELPAYSPWPARLLGLEPARDEDRTPEKVLREYDADKYAPLLAAVERDPALGLEDVKRLELGGDLDVPVAMSLGERLLVTSLGDASRRLTDALVSRVVPYAAGAASLVDLGCGYGYQLAHLAPHLPGVALRGGEYAPRAVELAARLRLDVEPFDFAAREWPVLAAAPGPAVVLLAYSIDQLPTAAVAVEGLARHRERIAAVICFDVEARAFGDGLLGLLRRRYAGLNRYAADLLDVLDARDDVELLAHEPDVIGVNPLLPASLTAWRFTAS